MDRKIPTKVKFTFGIILFLIFIASLYLLARHNAEKGYTRPISLLLNQYYQLQKTNPSAAKQALLLILDQDPKNKIALMELDRWKTPQPISEHPTTYPSSVLAIIPAFLSTPEVSKQTLMIPFSSLLVSTEKQAKPQTVETLFTEYYALKGTNPDKALSLLQEIINQDPEQPLAYAELGYLYLNQHQNELAIMNFKKADELHPTPQLATQIAYLLMEQKQFLLAMLYLQQSIKLTQNNLDAQSLVLLATLNILMNPPPNKASLPVPSVVVSTSDYEQRMNSYYNEKKINTEKAWLILKQIVDRYPDNVTALKEAGFFTLAQKNYIASLYYFKHAYELTNDALLAMQIGYILNLEGKNAHAYQYFWYATRSTDPKVSYAAERAMDNLSGMQTKLLPNPFFLDFYYAPFVFSRFALLVDPFIIRAGVTLNEAHKFQLYTSFRYTRDNRSAGGQIPQIYETNQAVIAVGASIHPFIKVPLVVFAEAGKAYSLINVPPLVQNDIRIGGAFFTEWGKKASFAPSPRWSHDLVGTFYSSIIYYSQYNNDVIADFRVNEGVRVFQFRATTITPYITGHLVLDTNHEFYNNILEVGPGIALTPTTRYNIVLRLETLKGFYLPVNSPSPNPYGSQYHNNVIQLVSYFEF